MKKPNPIDFETDAEYECQMEIYDEHLQHIEWCRNGAQRAFRTWVVVGALIGVCLVGAYFIKYGVI